MARLITTHEGRRQEYELDALTTLGRSSDNTIKVPGGKASRQHARVICENGTFLVEDLGSSNGTYVNNRKVKRQNLKHRDQLKIGLVEYSFYDEVDDPLLGERLGNYQIIDRLGQGGMGTVYLARQVSMDRDVALKVLKSELTGSAGFVERFMSEARVGGKLDHPNIVSIYDFGQEGEHYFFSMEYVKGETLLNRIERKGHLPASEVERISIEIAEALAAAHEQNILHKDVKPQNVILNSRKQVRLADLGMAGVMSDSPDSTPRATPEYVAPEVAEHGTFTVASDIYSLGATMFHMATGQPPFAGETPEELLRAHIEKPVPDPRATEPGVYDALAELIMSALAKKPEDRPTNSAAVAEALSGGVGGPDAEDRTMAVSESAPAPLADDVWQDESPPPTAQPKSSQKKQSERKKTGTKILSRGNPWKPVAIGIFLLASAIGGILLAYGIFYIIKGRPSEASTQLTLARSMIAAENTERARSILTQLQRSFPDSPEATTAGELLEGLRSSERGPTVRYVPDSERYGPVNTPEPTPTQPDPVEQDPASDLKARRAREAWAIAGPVIRRQIAEGNLDEAKTSLENIVENYEGTAEAATAQGLLTTVIQTTEKAARELLAKAARERGAGNLAVAWETLRELIRTFPKSEWEQKGEEQLAAIDREAKLKYFAAWKALGARLPNIDAGTTKADAQALALSFKGLPWERTASNLGKQADAVAAFYAAAVNTINTRSPKVAIEGIGLARLGMEDGKPVALLSGGRQQQIEWRKISVDDLYMLAPHTEVDGTTCVGAGLFFTAIGHHGYARTYFQKPLPTEKSYRLVADGQARRYGRTVVEYFDFSDNLANQRWQPVDGEWAFQDGRLTSYENEKAVVVLSDRRFGLGNVAAGFESWSRGQAAITFEHSNTSFIAVRKNGLELTLEFINGNQPAEAKTRMRDQRLPVRLQVKNNQATLFVGNSQAARLPVPGTSDWRAKLTLALLDGSGHFDNVTVEIGE